MPHSHCVRLHPFIHAVAAPLAGAVAPATFLPHTVAKRMRAELIEIRRTLNTTCRCPNMPGFELAIERADLAPH